jgi:transposase
VVQATSFCLPELWGKSFTWTKFCVVSLYRSSRNVSRMEIIDFNKTMIQSIKVSVSFKDLRWSRHIPRLAKSFYIVLGHLAVDFLKNEKVIYWPTPPESPDLNPIECVWHEMKHYLRKYTKPKTKAELEQGIYDFWTTMTAAKCSKYIVHLRKVIPEIIKRNGRASGFWSINVLHVY